MFLYLVYRVLPTLEACMRPLEGGVGGSAFSVTGEGCGCVIASCTGPAFAFAVSYREKLKGMRMGGSKKRVDAQFSKSRACALIS